MTFSWLAFGNGNIGALLGTTIVFVARAVSLQSLHDLVVTSSVNLRWYDATSRGERRQTARVCQAPEAKDLTPGHTAGCVFRPETGQASRSGYQLSARWAALIQTWKLAVPG